MAEMQVTFLEVPANGRRVPFTNQNGQRGVTSPVDGVTIDPASGYYNASTRSGSIYKGPVSNIGNQTIAMDAMTQPQPFVQNPYYPPQYQPAYPPVREVKRRTTAIILALFLGGLGIHRIYLGETSIALFYIFFCWTLIPAIIAGIEVIIYACMSDADFNNRYNRI